MSDYDGDDRTPRAVEGSSKDGGGHLSRSGKTKTLKKFIYSAASKEGVDGLTVHEFTNISPLILGARPHHGQVSSAFSTMHEHGYLARLDERRGRYEVYVLPEHVNGRPTREHASVLRKRKYDALAERLADVEARMGHGPTWMRGVHGAATEQAIRGLIDEVNHYIGRGK